MPTLLPLALAALGWADPADPPRAPATDAAAIVAALEGALSDAIAKAEPSVVAIAREKSANDETLAVRGRPAPPPEPNGFNGAFIMRQGGFRLDPSNAEMLTFDFGAGVVVGDEGEILTAFHVVKGAERLHVRAADRQAFQAEIVAADPRSDLAVIAPRTRPGVPAPRLRPIALGDAATLRKGAFLLALGNPYNAARDGKPSASWGILANIGRRIEAGPEQGDPVLRNYPTLLQLDAKLNTGMSGGAVVNLKGELVGLTTAAANAEGFDAQAGYAIPMDALGRNVVKTLMKGLEYEHGFLGIALDEAGTSKVAGANPGTPAAVGGVLVNDRIVGVGALEVTDLDSLVIAINSYPAGESVTLRLLREGKPLERVVQLAKRKVSGAIATNRPPAWRGLRVDFLSIVMTAATGRTDVQNEMARGGGVIVVEVQPGSPAEAAGLKVDQIIKRVDDRPVTTPAAFREAVDERDGPVTLQTDQGPVTVK